MSKKKELWSTFRGNNDFPVYNWFYFTEAYSRGLVRNILLKHLNDGKKKKILDPFLGTGTTILVAKEFGFDGFGIEISPLMTIISKAKTYNYDLATLEHLINSFNLNLNTEVKDELNENDKWIKKYFYNSGLNDLLMLKANINNQLNKEYNDYIPFFMCVLLKTLEIVSKAEKRGAMIGTRKIPELDAKKIYFRTLNEFFKELKKFYKKNELANNSGMSIHNADVSQIPEIKELSKGVDAIICSPPYLNKTEYARRFGIELSFLGYESELMQQFGTNAKEIKPNYLYKSVFASQIEKVNSYKTQNQNYNIDNYFIALENFVYNSHQILNKDGILSITIAGGCFNNFALDIQDYMKLLLEQTGFNIIDNKVEREIYCHKDRTKQIGIIKEFTIIGKMNV